MWYGVDINNENIADNFQAFVWEEGQEVENRDLEFGPSGIDLRG